MALSVMEVSASMRLLLFLCPFFVCKSINVDNGVQLH